MRNIIKFGTVLVAAAMLFTGCGSPMVPMTEDEENVVVNYAAGILAKHNSHQQEGLTTVYPEEEVEEEENVEPEDTEETIEEEPEESVEPEEEIIEDEPTEEASDETAGQMTLTEALSVPGIEFAYHDYSTSDNYRQGDIFSLDASEGNVLLMLNVNMTNTGSKAVECDLLSKQISYTLRLNGGSAIENETTMLTNDMSTYAGTLDPGQTEAVILLFDVPEDMALDISTMQLSIQKDGKTIGVAL